MELSFQDTDEAGINRDTPSSMSDVILPSAEEISRHVQQQNIKQEKLHNQVVVLYIQHYSDILDLSFWKITYGKWLLLFLG